MNATTRELVLRLFHDVDGCARELIVNAADNGLDPLDLYTLRDLRELSGCNDADLLALLACLILSLREGSVCLELSADELTRHLKELLPTAQRDAYAARLATLLQQSKFGALVGTDANDAKPVIMQQRGGRGLLYFQKYLQAERSLQQLFEQRMQLAPVIAEKSRLRGILDEVLNKNSPVQLDEQQRLAVALPLVHDFVVISGGPGTGKTSIVSAILRSLLRAGTSPERMAIACPTGRAAQRLTETLRAGLARLHGDAAKDGALRTLEAQTLHRLLGFRPGSGNFAHHRDNPLPYDVVIIDETSMLDIVLMARLLEATARSTKLILLGDKDQLPSVDAGSVLADLMPRQHANTYSAALAALLTDILQSEVPVCVSDVPVDCAVVLQKNYRSQPHIQRIAESIRGLPADTPPELARRIAEGMPAARIEAAWPSANEFTPPGGGVGGCWRAEQADGKRWLQLLERWALAHFGAAYLKLADETFAPTDANDTQSKAQLDALFTAINGARILTLLRDGFFGSSGVNDAVLKVLRRAQKIPPSQQRFAGVPIIISSNDYALQLFNGDVGVLLRTADGALRAVFEWQSGGGERAYASFPLEVLPAHEPAFAITVHKAQGSEYREILLVLPPEGARRMVNRQMIYTAITRAQMLAVVCTTPEILSNAICRSVTRTSGLALVQQAQPTAPATVAPPTAPKVIAGKAPAKSRRKRVDDVKQMFLFD